VGAQIDVLDVQETDLLEAILEGEEREGEGRAGESHGEPGEA
jgi:hypothetical protein